MSSLRETHMNGKLRFLWPPLVLLLGIGLAVWMMVNRKTVTRQKRPALLERVELIPAKRADTEVKIRARGTVMPSRQLSLQSEVSGRVTWKSPNLVPGGKVEAGELLVRIDARDYRAQLAQREAALEEVRAQIAIEAGRQRVAKREWELLRKEASGASASESLALRKPQAASLKASEEAALAAVKQARLNVSRTILKAPFNAQVESESVEIGQLVSPQLALAKLVGSDVYWVQASLPVDELGWLRFADSAAPDSASKAHVMQEAGPGAPSFAREGELLRLLPSVEPMGRLARVLIAVPAPQEGPLPLLLGSQVALRLDGQKLKDVVPIPRELLHDGKLWVFKDGELDIREVELAYRGNTEVYVKRGIEAGELLVTTPLQTPIQGLKLRDVTKKAKAQP